MNRIESLLALHFASEPCSQLIELKNCKKPAKKSDRSRCFHTFQMQSKNLVSARKTRSNNNFDKMLKHCHAVHSVNVLWYMTMLFKELLIWCAIIDCVTKILSGFAHFIKNWKKNYKKTTCTNSGMLWIDVHFIGLSCVNRIISVLSSLTFIFPIVYLIFFGYATV